MEKFLSDFDLDFIFLFSDWKEDIREKHVDFIGVEGFTEEDLKVSRNLSELI